MDWDFAGKEEVEAEEFKEFGGTEEVSDERRGPFSEAWKQDRMDVEDCMGIGSKPNGGFVAADVPSRDLFRSPMCDAEEEGGVGKNEGVGRDERVDVTFCFFGGEGLVG